jgi:hypothetical protein
VNAEFVVDATRTAWLTLALMMLLSRFAFQAAGPARMRAFLDGWQRGPVKRVWGTTGLVFAVFISIAALRASGSFGAFDLVLVVTLVTVLTLDGLVNALPAGFETFKDRLQAAWVARARTGWEGDSHLFGIVNTLLAAASVALGAVVILYRPIDVEAVVIAAVAATVLAAGLIAASVLTTPRDRPADVSTG